MTTSNELREKAKEHEVAARELHEQAARIDHDELAAKPVAERLVYAATARCPCEAGLAYDRLEGVRGSWDCSAVLLGTADSTVKHTDRLPFAFWDIKSEPQPSSGWATTRPAVDSREVE